MHMEMFDSSALCRIDHTIARSKCKNEQQSITTRQKMKQQKTITPQALREGDTIAFISPSSRLNILFSTRITRAKQFLEHHGFHVKIIYTDDLPSDHLQTIQQRCCEIQSAFSDVQVKAIICTIGGLSANELLPHLDYDLIRENPKIFVGYSDITLLHHALVTQCGLRTFYGPAVIPEFGEVPAPLEFTANHFFRTLVEPGQGQSVPRSETYTMEFKNWLAEVKDQKPRELIQAPGWKWLKGGTAEGRLMGGCLPSVVQLCGTKYLPDYSGRVLLLELPEGEQPGLPFSLDAARSAMADLRNAGVLEVVAGIVVGRPYMYDEEMRERFEKMVVDQCYGLEVPILANVDTGHADPMLTLPLDVMVRLDSGGKEEEQFMILEEVVVT